jgi:hypothetical protein
MATGLDTSWVAAPPDLAAAGITNPGQDEWAAATGIPATHPLVGGPGFGPTAADPAFGYSRVVDAAPPPALSTGGAAMPGGAPATPAHVRARWSDWRELFDPHSPMLWLLVLTLGAVSILHLRLEGRVGPARASAGVG